MDVKALQQRLDYLLGPVLSARRGTEALAQAIAALEEQQQAFVLHWIEVIDRSNYELAYQFAAAAPAALQRLDETAARTWLLDALDRYDREGLHSGTRALQDHAAYTGIADHAQAASFEQHANVLRLFVCGLAGRPLQLESAAVTCTDTDTLYLPSRITVMPSAAENFNIYKVLATLLWAQNRFGSHRSDLAAACAAYPDPQYATALLMHLETLRLTPRIAAALPGIARQLVAWQNGATDARCAPLAQPEATVEHSLALLADLYGRYEPPPQPWRIMLHTEARSRRDARVQRERGELAALLAQLLEGQQQQGGGDDDAAGRFSIDSSTAADGSAEYTLKLDGRPLEAPRAVAERIESLLQDLGEIPDDYLLNEGEDADKTGDDESSLTVGEASAGNPPFHYDEWDCRRRHYRRHWCTLREVELKPGDSSFIDATLARYRPQVQQLKRSFEALRGEDRRLRRQNHGDDIDFDAVIDARIGLRNGVEMPERLFTRRHKAERDLAALFMVDMSGSTKGWINEAEREALVMLCEALEVLGDRYAIYGFSGVTRQRCEIYPVKRFDQPYDAAVRGRIAGITPRDYTRMGAAIRHLGTVLSAVDARTRLLVTLSDGKPDDYSDHYRGEYGIEDTRQALLEAHHAGVRPFCITIDHQARDYLPHLYGPARWALVDQVEKLPLKVAEIYLALSS